MSIAEMLWPHRNGGLTAAIITMQWTNHQAMQLDARIRAIAEDLGADFFGVADLAPAHDFTSWQGGESLAQYPMAISIGIALLNPIVDRLPGRSEKAVAMEYKHHAYDIVNDLLDTIALRLSSSLAAPGLPGIPNSSL